MSKNSGLTLIEVLIAMSVMTIAATTLSISFSGSFVNFRKSQNNHVIASLMKRKMTELELEFRDQALQEIPESESGDFGKEFKDYSWRYETQEFEFPDLSSILVAQGEADEMTKMVVKQLTDHFTKSIRELRLVIVWKTGKKTVEYPVVTYITRFENKLTGIAQ